MSALRWYRDRGIQTALIGGAFLLASTVIAGYFATRKSDALPPLEIKTITGGREQVLATLALKPEQQIVDSAAFSALSSEFMLLSDTFGIAIERPTDFKWTAGRIGRAGSVSVSDIPLLAYESEQLGKIWKVDTNALDVRYGVRLDHPFAVKVSAKSVISGIPVGENIYDNAELAKYIEDAMLEDDPDANWFDRVKVRKELRSEVDSINGARLPFTNEVYSGVFVAAFTDRSLPRYLGLGWHHLSLFDKVSLLLRPGVPVASLLYTDRNRGLGLFNESASVKDVEVDGTPRPELILNRVGYVVQVDTVVFIVALQFLSDQDEATLRDLQRIFRSVRLRSSATK